MSISIGSSGQLHAIPRDSAGAALGGRPVSWRSADSTVARVGADGTVIGVAPGRATVIATIEGVQASATVIVTAGRVPVPVPVQPPRR
jgi:hypothetical protein